MPETITYTFNLPTIGGDNNTWGEMLNSNWTALDAVLAGRSSSKIAGTALANNSITSAQLADNAFNSTLLPLSTFSTGSYVLASLRSPIDLVRVPVFGETTEGSNLRLAVITVNNNQVAVARRTSPPLPGMWRLHGFVDENNLNQYQQTSIWQRQT